jgi:hypothetical protein
MNGPWTKERPPWLGAHWRPFELDKGGAGGRKTLVGFVFTLIHKNAVCSELITAMIAACSQLTTAHTCPNFRQASFATDPFSASADQCPLSLQ